MLFGVSTQLRILLFNFISQFCPGNSVLNEISGSKPPCPPPPSVISRVRPWKELPGFCSRLTPKWRETSGNQGAGQWALQSPQTFSDVMA